MMAGNLEEFSKHSSSQFSDDAVRRFLLGQLSAVEQAPFEERLFSDEGLETRVRLVECELADDYAFERLSAADRRLFEQNYLVTANRHQTLMVSSALHERFASASAAPTEQKITIRERLRSKLALTQPVWRFAFGLVILILLIGTAWLVTREPQIVRHFIPKRAPATATPAAAREAGHPRDTSTPVHHDNPPTMPPHEPAAPATVVSFVLSPNQRETAIPIGNVPRGEHDIARFQLELGPNSSGNFRAELLTNDGQSIFSADLIAVAGVAPTTIDFDVSARLLKTGNYEIRVTGGSTPRAGGTSYYFLVH